jgi:N-acetylglutamate synthase-like GNAT family acetyltransferase
MTSIRPAVAADVPAMTELVQAAYQHYVPRIGRQPAPMTADYDAAVRAGNSWIAEQDDTIVGLLVLVPERDHLLLENVAVSPYAQGSGLGRLLLEHAEQEARRLGLTEIRLYTNEAMTENIAYYQRRGYVETHRAGDAGFRRVFFSKQLQ